MATVIKNPMVLHCLQQFGITPAEARRLEPASSIGPASPVEFAPSLLNYLSDALLQRDRGSVASD